MEGFSIHVFLSALLFCVLIQIGSSVRCYTCTGAVDKNCNDPFNKQNKETLHAEVCTDEQICIKHKQPAIFLDVVTGAQKNISENTIRGCKAKTYCQENKDFSDHCSDCTSDYCNSSNAVVPSFIMIAFYIAKNLVF